MRSRIHLRVAIRHLLAQRNSVAKIAKPKGMKTIAGPGKTNMATPANNVPKPRTDTVSVRQNEDRRGGGSFPTEQALCLFFGFVLVAIISTLSGLTSNAQTDLVAGLKSWVILDLR